MSRNFINLGLLAIIALLASIMIWKPGQKQEVFSPLSTLNSSDIIKIHIQRDALEDVELEKKDGHWAMLSPYSIHADESRINELLKLPSTTSYVNFSSKERDLSNYGLTPLLAKVTFNESTFQFGKLETISKRRYILIDKFIHLITDIFYHQLRTSAPQFVSPRLLAESQGITRLNIGDNKYEKKHDGSWLVTPTSATTISADAINAFIESWQRLRASRVSRSGEKSSTEKISLELTNGNSLDLEVVREDDEVILVRRDLGLQYYLAKSLAESLFSQPTPDALQKF